MSLHRFSDLIARSQRLLQAARIWFARKIAPNAPVVPAPPAAAPRPASSNAATRAGAQASASASRASDDSKARLIGRIVDTIDLLAGMSARATQPAQRAELLLVRTALIETIEAQGATLIDSDQLDAERHKPIGVEPARDPRQAGPQIVRKGSTGFTLLGRVCRKQEVVISQPPPARPVPGRPQSP
ncbi:hypothetical protein [Opitutus sp. ER46]|uniref:hypothetical protein n=1 Tax=Opitutus sp. ER46 TaxID=2161864 RepID=UPI000D2FBD74|nr:hypothetical protein [Opitutus sp. ER46]PTX91198.1 hypothetical protein DB354_21440 [Opitutus sp. ER46]